ncbi:MAG TPA: hypothetical protein P5081_19610 [Phycisphaerae bacterium]|nr:hypothetical protein [Phycisphaerae bacterium]HRW55084.1 hypothetical protein [Phycisphaerae bacterium]
MMKKSDFKRIQTQLVAYLKPVFDDVTVEVGENIHYKGVNIVVTSKQFTGLLAEQRFHHVVRAIPEDLYNNELRKGIVWFELAPSETGMDLMKMARAIDIRDKEAALESKLRDAGFFSALRTHFEENSGAPSIMRFDATRQTLSACGLSDSEVEEACLFLISRGAYCDAHVLKDLAPQFLSESAA